LPAQALADIELLGHDLEDKAHTGRFARLLRTVVPVPLMRIYVEFERAWLTGPNAPSAVVSTGVARMFFRMQPGARLVQVYVDNRAANVFLQASREGRLPEAVREALIRLFPDRDVPPPARVWSNYCSHAAHWWRAGVDSEAVMRRMLQPWPRQRLYVCGEAFSQQQAWMEGAVDTARLVVDRLLFFRDEWLQWS
jgi:hypothetical protein